MWHDQEDHTDVRQMLYKQIPLFLWVAYEETFKVMVWEV
jgi:hypothetical protein